MKYILTLCLLGLSTLTFCQIAKGRIYLGGTAQFNTAANNQGPWINSTLTTTDSRTVQLTPFAGFMVSDRWGIGAELFFAHTAQSFESGGTPVQENKALGLGGGVFAELFVPLSPKFYFSLRNTLRYRTSESEITLLASSGNSVETTSSLTSSNFSLELLPRLSFFPNQNWACSMGIGNVSASLFTPNVNDDRTSTSFNATLGSLSLGLAYFFK